MGSQGGLRWRLGFLALSLVYLTHPLTWGQACPSLWSPPAGLGLVLVAWFGPRFAGAVLLGCGLVQLLQYTIAGAWEGELPFATLGWVATDSILTALESILSWWFYHRLGLGSRRLADPRSAMQFVLLVPGACACVAALVRVAFARWLSPPGFAVVGFNFQFALFWLDRALGLLILGPPLLVTVTPWLKRRSLLQRDLSSDRPESVDRPGLANFLGPNFQTPLSEHATSGGVGSRFGDWIEITGLALCASILCLALSGLHARRELLGWQLWGVQLLLIVWASLRQGLRGGTLVAAAAAVVPLLARRWVLVGTEDPLFQPLLQAHLVAQCCAALLVAAASSWVRIHEAGYRQVVSHVPVVIYSARLLREPRSWGGRDRHPSPPQGASGRPPGSEGPAACPALAASNADGKGLAEITLVSAASIKLLGCPADQLLGDYSRWLGCVHPEDHVVVLAALEQLARQDQPVTCEYRLAGLFEPGSSKRGLVDAPGGLRSPSTGPDSRIPGDASGTSRLQVRWMRDTLAPLRDNEGQLLGWEGVVIDITEQRHLADDLRRTTSMFHALVTNLPTGVFFIQGPHGTPIIVNSRARQLLGTREDSAASLEYLPKVYRLFRPDGTLYPAEELPVYLALKQGRTTMRDDIVVHRPDGRRIPLVTWAAPVNLGQRGTPDCAVWVLEDLTALHQAEAARKDTEVRLRAVIETMAEGLLVHDAKGTIVSCNSAAATFFGLKPDQLRGRTFFDLGWSHVQENGNPLQVGEHPSEQALRSGRPVRHVVLGVTRKEDVPALRKEDAATGKEEPERSPDSSFLTTSFRGRWILVNSMPLGNGVAGAVERTGGGPAAAPAGVVTTFSDISASVHARNAIRISEERYRGLVESLPLMLVQIDRDLRVIYSNPATSAITGYDAAEVADPQAWASNIHPEDLARVYQMNHAALAGQTARGELRYRARDGSEKVAYAFYLPRLQEGSIVGVTALLLDVTRERQLERELERARRLELIGRLSSGIAHDFNNLLGVVLNLTDLARGHLPTDHPVHADLKRIGEAGEQAASLAMQLLAFSKQRPAPARRLDINQIARRTLELLRATLPATIEVDARLSGEEATIHADETQVQQVLMNLCLNARDAMPQGGVLRVTTLIETLTASEPLPGLPAADSRQVHLCVQDTGQGMSEEVRNHIFEPFFSTKEGGTGLGLAVVQQIVESYGGRIEVNSKPGHGACFDIRWPLA